MEDFTQNGGGTNEGEAERCYFNASVVALFDRQFLESFAQMWGVCLLNPGVAGVSNQYNICMIPMRLPLSYIRRVHPQRLRQKQVSIQIGIQVETKPNIEPCISFPLGIFQPVGCMGPDLLSCIYCHLQ